jgi:D-glycero-alpha-D-manno-heptose-7-phosphate kinase
MLIVRSPVRISFGGGGTDLPAYYEQFGGAVLSTAINKYFYTILEKRTDSRIQVISSDLRVFETWRNISTMEIRGTGLEIPLAALKHMECDVPVNLFLASEIPPGTGLGSSASVCVNILKTLAVYMYRPMSKHDLAERAFHIARHVLGHHVGKQDEYAAAYGGLNFITFDRDGTTTVEPVVLGSRLLHELEASLMLFFTGSAHHSWTILQEQETATRKDTGSAVGALHEVRRLADRMRAALLEGDLLRFGQCLHEGWEAKKRVSNKVSNSRIDHLYEVARRQGAIGGKITGAGGGGFLLLFCPTPQQEAVRAAFASEGIQEMTFSFDTQGAQVLVNDPFIDGDEACGSRWVFFPLAQSGKTVSR